jgi:hypothetical protein
MLNCNQNVLASRYTLINIQVAALPLSFDHVQHVLHIILIDNICVNMFPIHNCKLGAKCTSLSHHTEIKNSLCGNIVFNYVFDYNYAVCIQDVI